MTEHGTHAELVAIPGGHYAELYGLQAKAFRTDDGDGEA